MPGMPGMTPPMPIVPKMIYHGLPEGASTERFFMFYPNYINSKKTVQQGRRIPKDVSCEDPLAEEMSEVCVYLNLPHVLELGKKYARDWMVPGRIRVRLLKDDGSFENPEIQNRKQLMLKMAELIPKLQSRKTRLEKAAAEAAAAANASSAGGAGASSSSGSNKKKGKKKGKR
ncbi:hypothetical protein PINS_up005106 [Pythium insidiosum]|nr:hypothetical protein PINS_up005106 [Pythium insidiosum]